MKKTQLIIGIISLALAALLFSLRVTKIVVFLADGTATIYPAIGLAILGVVLVVKSLVAREN